jgi:4'-phosphopantetheinyl transferase
MEELQGQLSADELHIWTTSLAMEPDPQRCREWLDSGEQQRAQALQIHQARRNYLNTRLLLKSLLGAYLGAEPQDVSLQLNAHGKPELAPYPENQGLVFNVSHSGDQALLAFGRNCQLGVDLESLERTRQRDLRGLARFCLDPAENARMPEPDPAQFLRYWVAKEAFCKATGRGIALGLQKVTLLADHSGFAHLPEEFSSQSWNLWMQASGEYSMAVVHSGSAKILSFPGGFPTPA